MIATIAENIVPATVAIDGFHIIAAIGDVGTSVWRHRSHHFQIQHWYKIKIKIDKIGCCIWL